jgi:hypothetical protein
MTQYPAVRYQCARFKGIVGVIMEQAYVSPDELSPQPLPLRFHDCSRKLVCGIMDGPIPRWRMCPAHPQFDPSTLPETSLDSQTPA